MSAGRAIPVVLIVVGLSLVAVGLAGAAGAFGGPVAVASPSTSPPAAGSPTSTPATTEPPMVAPSPSPTPSVEPTVEPTLDVDAVVRSFFVELETALREGRAGDMVDALAPAVFERYGREACEAQLGSQAAEPSRTFEILEIGMPAPWDYERDGLTTTIDDAIAVRARVTDPTPSGDVTTETEVHVQIIDGRVRWFTDCGTPLA